MEYFNKLNYSLANEDTQIEYSLLPEQSHRVFTICGSGARVLPLIAKNPKQIKIVDVSQEQLWLCELRIAAAQQLTYDEFLYFLGYRQSLDSVTTATVATTTATATTTVATAAASAPAPTPTPTNSTESAAPDASNHIKQAKDRRALFASLKLSDPCHDFWMTNSSYWETSGFIFLGKWERHFQKLNKFLHLIFRHDFKPIFAAETIEEQKKIFRKIFRPFLFKTFLRIVASEFIFNRFLYRGHFSGTADKRTEQRPPWQFIYDEFTRLFTTTKVSQSYFLQVLFLGSIQYEEGLPLEASPAIFQSIKNSQSEILYCKENLLEILKNESFDFISLSDTISYLCTETGEQILSLLHPTTPIGATIVIRSFLRAPQIAQHKHWTLSEVESKRALSSDCTGVYQFHIFTKHSGQSINPFD